MIVTLNKTSNIFRLDCNQDLGLPEDLKCFAKRGERPIGDMTAVVEESHRVALQRCSDSLQACVQSAEIFQTNPDRKECKKALASKNESF